MIRNYGIIREAAARVAKAAESSTDALRQGRVEQEPAFTDRMLGAIEEAMQDFESKGVVWQAKTLTNLGRNAQEKHFGADFAGVLSVNLPGFIVQKGFLAQAKLIEPNHGFSRDEFERLKEQCALMLKLTPDSFIFLYSKGGVAVIPAISVVSSEPRNPHEFYSRSISRFYEEHFESFIGDARINEPSTQALENLRRTWEARRLLYLEARAG